MNGYRYSAVVVDALAESLLSEMDDEQTWGLSASEDAGKAGGFVLRQDPRNLAQAALDQLYRQGALAPHVTPEP